MGKKWYDVLLEYVNNEQTYKVIMTMLTAFGVKISDRLQLAITNVGTAIGHLAITIEELIFTIKDEKDAKQIEVKE